MFCGKKETIKHNKIKLKLTCNHFTFRLVIYAAGKVRILFVFLQGKAAKYRKEEKGKLETH